LVTGDLPLYKDGSWEAESHFNPIPITPTCPGIAIAIEIRIVRSDGRVAGDVKVCTQRRRRGGSDL
jgi:hypothetical protein